VSFIDLVLLRKEFLIKLKNDKIEVTILSTIRIPLLICDIKLLPQVNKGTRIIINFLSDVLD